MTHRVDDWIKLNWGDRVHRRDNPRHTGRVDAIIHGAYARVRWDNGWREDVPLDEIVRALWRGIPDEDHE